MFRAKNELLPENLSRFFMLKSAIDDHRRKTHSKTQH